MIQQKIKSKLIFEKGFSVGNVKEFTESSFVEEVLNSKLPVVVDFWAEWCGPCKMLSPIIESIAPEFEGKVILGKVNVDNNQELAAKYGIISIPTLLFFKEGKVISQHTGLLSANALKEKIRNTFGIL